ncbi:MAG: zinc-dependent metalloprotease, partial [Blastocatellia bacterium]
MKMKKLIFHAALLLVVAGTVAWAQNPPTIAQRSGGAPRQDGFLPFYWDAARGRLLMEITLDREMIYFVTVAKAIGSVELGVDRGSGGGSRLVHFERQGGRVVLAQKNLRFRALNGNRAAQQVMEDSFAGSIIASFPIEAEEQGRILIDATPFLVRDANNLEGALRQRNEGAYRLDPARSGIYPPRTKNYPRNTEIEVTLTYASDTPGRLVSRVAPDGRALTIRLHHSFVQLPEGYQPRAADPRVGVNGGRFKDYSTPFNEGMDVQWVSRFRLEKQDPNAALSEPKKPIIFYLDPSMPASIREASREGVLWWNHAFEAAGFKNAIQVLDPPEDMDPMDSRYNYILWINRDERGFSVGGGVSDPRTGEILVAKPRMDSHRIRTIGNYWRNYRMTAADGGDPNGCGAFLLPYESLLATLTGQAAYSNPKTEEQLVALRQALVTAHEIGHCLGFAHNWTSSINDRASVMEYPSPRLKLVNGQIDLSDAFQRDIGEYDKYMVRYGYTEFPPGREREGLDAIVKEMRGKGILYTSASDPRWSRYDDLASPAQYLRETMAQRKILLDRYGPEILQAGQPYGDLRGMGLWMTYLHHRWAIDTGVRYIGGMYNNLAVKGETIPPTEIVPASLQREALGLLMETLQPANLALPDRLLPLLAPSPDGRDIEEFNLPTGEAFDQLAAARTLAALALEQLLDPQRAARLVAFADRQANALTLPETLAAVRKATWNGGAANEPAKLKSLRRVTQRAALDALLLLGAHAQATPEVRAVTLDHLTKLHAAIAARHDPDALTEAHLRQCERDLKRYLENPATYAPKSNALPQP